MGIMPPSVTSGRAGGVTQNMAASEQPDHNSLALATASTTPLKTLLTNLPVLRRVSPTKHLQLLSSSTALTARPF